MTTDTPSAALDRSLPRDAADLHRSLSELVRVVQFRDRDRICCHDISVTQCYALEELARRGPITLGELAAALYLDKSTASRVVDGLERKGYAIRRPHPDDGRALLVISTDEGRELCSRIESELLDETERLISDFPPDVRRSMVLLLARLARSAFERIRCGSTCGT